MQTLKQTHRLMGTLIGMFVIGERRANNHGRRGGVGENGHICVLWRYRGVPQVPDEAGTHPDEEK